MSSIKLKLFYEVHGEKRELISLNDATTELGIAKRSLQHAMARSKTPRPIHIGGVGYFDAEEFRSWKATRKTRGKHGA